VDYMALYPRGYNSSLFSVFIKMDNVTLINLARNCTFLVLDLTVPLEEGISVINWGMIFRNLYIETTLDDTRLRVCTMYGNSPIIESEHREVCWKEIVNTLH
jgi:hypothetical protein